MDLNGAGGGSVVVPTVNKLRRQPTARSAIVSFVCAFCWILWCNEAAAGPITFNTALPIAQGQAIVRGQAVVTRATGDSTVADRSFTGVGAESVLAYGVTRDLALFALLPLFLHKALDFNLPDGRRVSRGTNGFGDVALVGRYTLLEFNWPGETIRVAPFAGIKMPTGSDSRDDRFGRIPRPLQPGSGSWDPLLGAIFSWQTLDWEFDSDAGYRFNTRADGFEFGDIVFADLSFQYRIWPWQLASGGVPAFVYAVLESNFVWQGKNRVGGMIDSNSGGFTWIIDPGIQFVTERYVVEAAVRLPAVQDLNGTALGGDFQIVAGFRWNFFLPYHL